MQPLSNTPLVDADPCERFRLAYLDALRQLETLRMAQWEQCRVTLPQLRVLLQVRDSPGITTGQLAQCLGITVSTTSGLVAKLADAGLVVRDRNDDDRRQVLLGLTDAGRVQAGELADHATPFLRRVADELGDRLDATTGALEMLAAAMAAARARYEMSFDGGQRVTVQGGAG